MKWQAIKKSDWRICDSHVKRLFAAAISRKWMFWNFQAVRIDTTLIWHVCFEPAIWIQKERQDLQDLLFHEKPIQNLAGPQHLISKNGILIF